MRKLRVCAGVIALLGVQSAFAVVGVSNLGEASAAAYGFTTLGFGFTTGSGAGWTLDSAVVKLEGIGSTDLVQFSLRADAGGNPGAIIESLGSTQVPNGTTDITLTPVGPITLAASTTYWLLGENTNPNNSWVYTTSDNETGLAGWSISDVTRSFDGTTWSSRAGTVLAEINVTPVPEPASLLVIGGALAAFARRRRA